MRWGSVGRPIGSALSTTAPITSTTSGPRHFVLYGVGQDGQIYGRSWNSGRWTPWAAIGRPTESALSTGCPDRRHQRRLGQLTLFAVAQDGQLYRRSWDSGTWRPWEAIGRPAESALSTSARIAAITPNPLHSDVFAVAQDGQLYGRAWNHGTWEPWVAIGRPAASALSPSAAVVATTVSPSGLDLFAVGQDGQLYGVAPSPLA